MRKCGISWANKYISSTGNCRDQKSNQSGLGFVQQIQTRVDVKIVLPTAPTTLIQHRDHADAELRLWHLDFFKGTRKMTRPKENTNIKLRPAKTRMMENMKKLTTGAQMMKQQRVAIQTQIAIRTVTSPA